MDAGRQLLDMINRRVAAGQDRFAAQDAVFARGKPWPCVPLQTLGHAPDCR
jgi:hypothetical protein